MTNDSYIITYLKNEKCVIKIPLLHLRWLIIKLLHDTCSRENTHLFLYEIVYKIVFKAAGFLLWKYAFQLTTDCFQGFFFVCVAFNCSEFYRLIQFTEIIVSINETITTNPKACFNKQTLDLHITLSWLLMLNSFCLAGMFHPGGYLGMPKGKMYIVNG